MNNNSPHTRFTRGFLPARQMKTAFFLPVLIPNNRHDMDWFKVLSYQSARIGRPGSCRRVI